MLIASSEAARTELGWRPQPHRPRHDRRRRLGVRPQEPTAGLSRAGRPRGGAHRSPAGRPSAGVRSRSQRAHLRRAQPRLGGAARSSRSSRCPGQARSARSSATLASAPSPRSNADTASSAAGSAASGSGVSRASAAHSCSAAAARGPQAAQRRGAHVPDPRGPARSASHRAASVEDEPSGRGVGDRRVHHGQAGRRIDDDPAVRPRSSAPVGRADQQLLAAAEPAGSAGATSRSQLGPVGVHHLALRPPPRPRTAVPPGPGTRPGAAARLVAGPARTALPCARPTARAWTWTRRAVERQRPRGRPAAACGGASAGRPAHALARSTTTTTAPAGSSSSSPRDRGRATTDVLGDRVLGWRQVDAQGEADPAARPPAGGHQHQ